MLRVMSDYIVRTGFGFWHKPGNPVPDGTSPLSAERFTTNKRDEAKRYTLIEATKVAERGSATSLWGWEVELADQPSPPSS